MGKRYKVFPLKATDKAELFDATAEELRLLIALIERGGDAGGGDRILRQRTCVQDDLFMI